MGGGVQSIERAFSILRALSLGPAGVTDLSDRTGLPKSTVSRLLTGLEYESAVAQNAQGQYQLGDGIDELANALRDGQNAIELARPHLAELMELTGEAVGLNRLDGPIVRTLTQVVDPLSSVTVRDWTGEATPAHAVPAGLVILAFSTKALQERFFEYDLEVLTDKTMTEAADFRARFKKIREVGHEWVFQEFKEDINSVAAPILDPAGRTPLAVHIHGPAFRFPGEHDLDELGAQVAATADRIRAQLLDG